MGTYQDNIFILILMVIFIFAGIMLFNKFSTGKNADNDRDNIVNKHLNDRCPNYKHIVDDLYYDTLTHIVYFKNITSDFYQVYIPYIASNGLPFRYNTDVNKLEEINTK